MPGKLLILTFHAPKAAGAFTGADIRFKRAAFASGLVSGDAMDETDAKDFLTAKLPELAHNGKVDPFCGLDLEVDGNTRIVTLNRVGGNAWRRSAYVRPPDPANPSLRLKSDFEKWLDLVLETPVEVLVLGGHHEDGVLWGAEDKRVTTRHRWYTGLLPESFRDETNELHSLLAVRGHTLDIRPDEFERLRAGPFDLTEKKTLKPCRMLVILGCNGAAKGHSVAWRKWIEAASDHGAPWIFGWYGVHAAPPDAMNEFIGDEFWPRLKAIATSAGATDLSFLHTRALFPRIAKAWMDAAKEAFKKQSNLFFSSTSVRRKVPRGVSCVDPDGVLRSIVDKAGTIKEESLS